MITRMMFTVRNLSDFELRNIAEIQIDGRRMSIWTGFLPTDSDS